MAQKLYKWTGDIIEPTAWESSMKAPQWYGSDDDGVSYAFLDEDFAKLCKSSKDDLAATTASSAKTWVKTKSQEAKIINNQCKDTIRQTYTLEDELQANRTASTDDGKAVLDAIAKIVADHSKLKDALVGD